MLPSISFPSMVPGMLRKLLLAALLCPLASFSFAQLAKPPATLAELKANPAGLTAYSGDIRGEYGNFPVSAVYVRKDAQGQISYLVYGDSVFGYFFRFQNPGSDTPLWRQTVDAALDATFSPESFRREDYGNMASGNIYYRDVVVLNTKAYDEAVQGYGKALDERMLAFVSGGGSATPAVEKAGVPGVPRPLADYLKSFPETVAATLQDGMVAGFERCSSSLAEFPYDALHVRKAGGTELLVVSRKGVIIGYFAKIAVTEGSELRNDIRKAGLAAAFPDPAFERLDPIGDSGFVIYGIKDRTAFAAAREAHLAEEGAKLKELLNP